MLEKLRVAQLVKEFAEFSATQRFNIVFIRARVWYRLWVKLIYSAPSRPVCFSSTSVAFCSYALVIQVSSVLQVFLLKFLCISVIPIKTGHALSLLCHLLPFCRALFDISFWHCTSYCSRPWFIGTAGISCQGPWTPWCSTWYPPRTTTRTAPTSSPSCSAPGCSSNLTSCSAKSVHCATRNRNSARSRWRPR